MDYRIVYPNRLVVLNDWFGMTSFSLMSLLLCFVPNLQSSGITCKMFDTAASNSMRQASQSGGGAMGGMTAQEQLQGMLLASQSNAPSNNAPAFMRHPSASSTTALEGPGGATSSSSSQMNADLLAQFRQQQHFLEASSSNRSGGGGGDNSSLQAAVNNGHVAGSFPEMMYMQQQFRAAGDMSAFQMTGAAASNMGAFSNNGNGAESQSFPRTPSFMQQQIQMQQQQQQFNQQQQQHQFSMGNNQMWMNEAVPQPMSLQEQLFQHQQQQNQQQQQQQQMMGNYFGMPQQQQQQLQQFEPRRRRSSISEAGSLSPLQGRRQSHSDNLAFGNNEYARFLASSLMQQQQQQQHSGLPNPLSQQQQLSPLQHQQQQTLPLQHFHVSTPLMENDALMGSMMMSHSGLSGLSGGGFGAGGTVPTLRKEKKKRAKSFPEKLMTAMMDNANEQAVAWLPDGKSFVIVSPDLFVSDVLNSVFKQAKYASFVRKLHRWGFVRLTSGTGTDCFHHPLFNRNRREWASKITCSASARESTIMNPIDAANASAAVGAAAAAASASLPMVMIKAAAAASRGGSGGGFGDASSSMFMGMGGSDKPPSLAGVERFIRAKAAAATATNEAAVAGPPSLERASGLDLAGMSDMRSPPHKASFLPTMSEVKLFQANEGGGGGNLSFSDATTIVSDLGIGRADSFMSSRLEDKSMITGAGGMDALDPIKGSKDHSPISVDREGSLGSPTEV
jgi:HSF-type DNA-binding